MLSDKIDSINETKSFFLFENNDSFLYNNNYFQNLNRTNNFLSSVEEDKDISKNKVIPSYFYINKKEEENINKNEGIPTELRIKENQNTYSKYDDKYDFLHKIVENNEGNAPHLYSFEKILSIFKKEENKNKFSEIINKYNNKEEIKEDIFFEKPEMRTIIAGEENIIDNELIDQKKQNKKESNKKVENLGNKRGRKTNEIKNIGTHNKMVPDNIIKKIKAKIFEYAIVFLNNILNNNKKEDKLYKLDYKYVNRLNREQDLQYLDMKLKELFSKDISPKYIIKNRHKDFNKRYISKILNNQSDNTILFVFNITFRDWLDLFTLKKNIKDIIFKYDYLDKDIDSGNIQKSLFSVDNLLNKIMNENNKEYLTMFIFLLYNYERWFYNKTGRKGRKK